MAELTGEQILELIQKVMDENKTANKEMISELAFQISHPAPTEKELQAQKNLWEARVESAKILAAGKEQRRKFCTGQSDKPHRRPNDMMQGMMAGRSLVNWHLTQFSSRDPVTQKLCLSQPTPIGICIWCHTEFKPGDPDYMEAIGWGMDTQVSDATMNIHTGDFVEMVENR